MTTCYKYPRPALTVDTVVFALEKGELQVLLIERAHEPYQGCWAFPGGFVDVGEDLKVAAMRELQEETGMKDVEMQQMHCFGKPGRDPREHVVSVVHLALVNKNEHVIKADSDAKRVAWFDCNELPALAFDHEQILEMAMERIGEKLGAQQERNR